MPKTLRQSTNRLLQLGLTAAATLLVVSCSGTAAPDLVGPSNSASDIVRLSVAPQSAHLLAGDNLTVVAWGHRRNGDSTVVAATWSTTVGSLAGAGVVHADQGGMGTVRAVMVADPALSASASLEVGTVELTPVDTTLSAGGSIQVSTIVVLPDSSVMLPQITWSATGGTISPSGVYSAPADTGTYQVLAQFTGHTATASLRIRVTPPTLRMLVLNPAAVSLLAGETRQFSLAALWSNGSITLPAITWSATGGAISPAGLFTAGPTAGSFRIVATASSNNLADTSSVTISLPAPTLTQLVVSPNMLALTTGGVQQYGVSATWSDGSTAVPGVTWSATGGTITTNGLFSASTTPGTFRVIATQQGGTKADTATVTISIPVATLVTLVLNPHAFTIQPGATQQFTVAGGWSDELSTTPPVTYVATGGAITSTGLYTAGTTPGAFRVIATQQGGMKADTSAVTICPLPPTLTTLVLNPSSVSLVFRAAQQFSVAGAWSDGSSTTPSVTYAATGGTITTAGLYTAGTTAGTFRVIATQQGGTKADTSTVIIGAPPPTLTSLIISPSSITLAPGGTQQFTVSGTWSDGSSSVPFASFAATGGSITSNGMFTSGAMPGTYLVSATLQGGTRADTAIVTVNGLWAADMETGNLQQWSDNVIQSTGCGGQFNSGPEALTVPNTDFAHSGLWSAKMTISSSDTAGFANGTRMFRWCEPMRNRELYYSVWYYFPQRLTRAFGGWLNVFQFKSVSPVTNHSDPFFFLDLRNASDGSMHFLLEWWNGLTIEGPAEGQTGYREWRSAQALPVGRWFQVQARYVCAGDFTGAIQVWQDGVEIFNLSNVRTMYPNNACQWSVNNYGTGISPSPVNIYIDDAVISRSRVGPWLY